MDEELRHFAFRHNESNLQKYRINDNSIERNHSESRDFHNKANMQYINEKKKPRNKYEHDAPFERVYDGDLKSKVSHSSRYDKSSYMKASTVVNVGSNKNASPVRENIKIVKGGISAVNYRTAPSDHRLVYQRNMQPSQDIAIYSDERHGARIKDFYSSRGVHHNISSNMIEDVEVNPTNFECKSRNNDSYTEFKFSASKNEMADDEMTHSKISNAEWYPRANKKCIPISKKVYYNRALSIENQNMPIANKLCTRKRDLPYNMRSYHNAAMSIEDENMHTDQAESQESYSYKGKVKSPTPNEEKFYVKDQTSTRLYRDQFNGGEKVSVRKRVSENNSVHYHEESSNEVFKREAGCYLSKFEDSHLPHKKYSSKREDFVSQKQDRDKKAYKRHSRGYRDTERNQRTRIQDIEMGPMYHPRPRKSLNMHDAFVIGNVMLGEEAEKPVAPEPHLLIISENEDGLRVSERQCWSKSCFSLLEHSHVFDKYSIKKNASENREAILETLPLHGPKVKSFWSKIKDSCACLRRISSAFEIWNGTLKSIEGQQGTGVVSYFVFLRWLIALNMILLILYVLLVTLPHTVFVFLPLKEITIAPNHTVINEKFLNQFSSSTKLKRVKRNSSFISNVGSLFDDVLKEGFLDVAYRYSKKNLTTKERHTLSEYCESKYTAELQNRTDGFLNVIQDLLQGTGWLQSTVLFLGYYTASEISYFGLPYHVPVAIIFVLFLSFVVCLGMMTQYSSHGVQETILARKGNYLVYSNLLFCSWDYCIEDKKSSIIRHSSILNEIKSTLNEERRKMEVQEWSRGKKFRVYFFRCFVNVFVMCILCGSYYLIYRVVHYQLKEQQLHRLNKSGVNTLFVQYLSPIVITCLNIFVPIIFTNIVKFEMYNTQTQINIALFRTVFLRLSSIFVLVGLLDQQITCEPKDICGSGISATCRSPICWETYVGQQFYKLAITDFFVYIIMFIAYDFPRDVIVRRFNNKVTQIVGRQAFDLPNQVLALVYSQTLCWLGIIYSPLLPVITMIKFVILFHVKKIMVLRYCIPAPISYKASRSNAMFMMILMLSFFIIMIIHGYSLSSIEPSAACSPFRHYVVMLDSVSDAFSHLPTFVSIINFFFSAKFLLPAILLMCITIYYYWTIIVANRKMSKVLKAQIMLEGRDKQFLLNRLTEVAKGHI